MTLPDSAINCSTRPTSDARFRDQFDDLGKFSQRAGVVPLVVPVLWFMCAYPAYVISNAVLTGAAASQALLAVPLWQRTLVRALVLAAVDVGCDPMYSALASDDRSDLLPRYWRWRVDNGAWTYLGVPIRNFVTWFAAGLAMFGLVGLAENAGWVALSSAAARPAISDILVVLSMAANTVYFQAMRGVPLRARLNVLLSMGLPTALALRALLRTRRAG